MGPRESGASVLVVGLGAMGAATLHQLARRGVPAIGFDRWRPPHAHGSTHGETRVTRAGVGEGDVYAPLALRSHEIWRDLEAATGERLMLSCGMLTLEVPGGGAIHGRPGFLARSQAVARRFAVPHEMLDAAELAYRYPQLGLRGDERGYYEPGGGVVFPERCVAAQLAEARRLGARVVTDATVTALVETRTGVEATVGGEIHRADAAVVTAGAWTPGLIGGPFRSLALQPQALHWFACDDPAAYAPDRFPTFMWVHGPAAEDAFYGFPAVPGLATPGVKVATEAARAIGAPEALRREVEPGLAAHVYGDHVRGRLKGVGPRAHRSAACLYTTSADADFVIGRLEDRPRTWGVSACSGHGFKHSAAVGELLAAQVSGEPGARLPAAFAPSRAALHAQALP